MSRSRDAVVQGLGVLHGDARVAYRRGLRVSVWALSVLLAPVLLLGAFPACAGAQAGRLGEPIAYDGAGTPRELVRVSLASGPHIEISATRTVTVSFETLWPTPPAVLAYGFLLPEHSLRVPRFCGRAREESTPDSLRTRRHEVRFSLAGPEGDPCDAYGDVARDHGGTVWCELEIYDPQDYAQSSFPFRFAYRRDRRVPCVHDGPWVDVVSESEIIIAWGTDVPAAGVLRCAVTGLQGAAPEERTIAFAADTAQRIRLAELAPGDECEYWICLQDPGGDPEEIRAGPYRVTLPQADEPFLFAVMGDSQPGRGSGAQRSNGVNLETLRLFCRDAAARGARFIVFTGDMGDGFTTSPVDLSYEWQTWKRGAEVVGHRLPVYELMGNHDALIRAYQQPDQQRVYLDPAGAQSSEALFGACFSNPDNGPPPEGAGSPPYAGSAYSFRWGRSLFIALNSNYWFCSHPEDLGGNLSGHLMDGQLAWARALVEGAGRDPAIDHVFLFLHHPVFPCAGHSGDAMWYHGGSPQANRNLSGEPLDRSYVVARRDEFWSALARCGKVRAVFAGHEHNHSRLLVTDATSVYADNSGNPDFVRPIWQCVSGGCGARQYTADPVPWSQEVEAFSMQAHYTLVAVSGADVARFAIDDGLAELDGCLLWEGDAARGRALTLSDWQMRCGRDALPLRIERLWPQPGRATVSLLYRALCSSAVRVRMCDAEGREVAVLFDGLVSPGLHRLDWDGRDASGRAAASGVYFCRLSDSADRSLARRVLLIR